MKLTVNGTEREYTGITSLKDLVGQACQNPEHVIAEVNGEIVKKISWEASALKDGDSVELVTFVGGG